MFACSVQMFLGHSVVFGWFPWRQIAFVVCCCTHHCVMRWLRSQWEPGDKITYVHTQRYHPRRQPYTDRERFTYTYAAKPAKSTYSTYTFHLHFRLKFTGYHGSTEKGAEIKVFLLTCNVTFFAVEVKILRQIGISDGYVMGQVLSLNPSRCLQLSLPQYSPNLKKHF